VESFEGLFHQVRGLLDLSADVFVLCDRQGRFAAVSAASRSVWGYAEEELLGRSYMEFVDPRDHERTALVSGTIQEGQRVRAFVNRYIHKDGSLVPMMWSSVWNEREQIFFGVARDISEWTQAEESLRQSEERFRVLFQKNPLPIWLYDRVTLRFLEVNEAAQRAYGYSEEEFARMSLLDIVPENRQKDVALTAQTGRSATEPRSAEWVHIDKSGRVFPVWGWSHDVTLNGGDARIALAIDMTERRMLEERLRQGQKMEALGQLAGGVAHDFNNLLSVLRGYADLIQLQPGAGETVRKYAVQIQEACEIAFSMTRKLLAFSRKQPMVRKVADLNELLRGVLPMLDRMLPRNIRVSMELADGLPMVRLEPSQMEMVLMNLLSNARDAMPEGGTVVVRTTVGELNEQLAARLEVVDSGCGMSQEVLQQAFEPFFTTKPRDRGTGLGLPACYGVIQQFGGTILLESEPGQGTRVEILLPAVAGEQEQVEDFLLQ
jgi:PAS domain S-box-containing protein